MESLALLQSHLFELERELLRQEVRTNAARLAELLDDEFFEIGASGTVWTKREIIDALQKQTYATHEIDDFKVKLLSQDVALVTYRCRRAGEGAPATDSLRSAVWIYRNGHWKLAFHQGTKLKDKF